MTRVRYYPSDYELLMAGHAGTAPTGQDLVCCACSTLAYTLLQALEDMGIDYALREDAESAEMYIIASPIDGEKETCSTIFDTVMAGLRALSKQFPEAIDYAESGGGR